MGNLAQRMGQETTINKKDTNKVIIKIVNGGSTARVEVQNGTEVGHIRSLRDDLEDVGAPSSYTFAINGQGVEDSKILQHDDTVTLRPRAGEKGAA